MVKPIIDTSTAFEQSVDDVIEPRPLDMSAPMKAFNLDELMDTPDPVEEPPVVAMAPQLDMSLEVDFGLFDTSDGQPMKMSAQQAIDVIDGDLEIYNKLLNCVGGGV